MMNDKGNKMMYEVELILEAQKAQLTKPTLACVNSESAFVAQRLRDAGHTDLASRYWSYVCGCGKDFGDEVAENEKKLKEIDNGFVMPSWGTYGT
jgi:hypothetical protein